MNDDQELDNLILSVAKTRWQKTAMIIAKIGQGSENEYFVVPDEKVAERIVHLVGKNLLESQGDLTLWRFSEVRLPAKKPASKKSPRKPSRGRPANADHPASIRRHC